jgi:hypothetical protein
LRLIRLAALDAVWLARLLLFHLNLREPEKFFAFAGSWELL